ncbi:MAG: hypothetical protein RKE49_13845 [Oceanicaulis sp.]
MAIWPWYGGLALGKLYDAGEFLSVHEYKNVRAWAEKIGDRPAAKRGRRVNKVWGDEADQVRERHGPDDVKL